MNVILKRPRAVVVIAVLATLGAALLSSSIHAAKRISLTTGITEGPGGMLLLPGYQHRRGSGMDTQDGVIWKDRGPEIHYEIGDGAGNQASAYAEHHHGVWTIVQGDVGSVTQTVTGDEAHEMLIVSVGTFSNFAAHHVRTRRDIAEILVMVSSYREIKALGGR